MDNSSSPDREWFQRVPKVDLHLHLDGALRVSTIRDLAAQAGKSLPTTDLNELAKYVQVPPDCNSLMDFLKVFEYFYDFLKSPGAVERIAYELCEDQARDNVVYFETRFAPPLQATRTFSTREVVAAAAKGLEQGMRDFKVAARMILCTYRPLEAATSLDTVNLAKEFQGRVVGIDLAGDEREPASRHQEAFRLAKEWGIGRTVHAGEAGPPSNIVEALDSLYANRIGHAVTLRNDSDLMQRFKDEQIPIEINLTSNVQTCSVAKMTAHPFGQYYQNGLMTTLNTDDPGVSNITLSHEYQVACNTFSLDKNDVRKLVENAARAAFLDEREKQKLLTQIKNAWPS